MSKEPLQPQPDPPPAHRLTVLLPMPFSHGFDYRASEPFAPGTIVRVPLARQHRLGVVWDPESPVAQGPAAPPDRLKAVEAVLPLPPLRREMRRFIDWVAGYTLAPAGAVLRMALPPHIVTAAPPTQWLYHATGRAPTRLTPARERVLALFADGGGSTLAEVVSRARVSESVVRSLVEQGVLARAKAAIDAPPPAPDPERPGPTLSPPQAAAAERLSRAVREGGFQPILLAGVTGSGKTEVYFEAIAEALRQPGGQALVLLPEIALTSQWLDRFHARFGARPALWHSDLSRGARRRTWHGVADGTVRLVVGARSALFLPFSALRLIIVDEEHDPSYKQEDGVCYHARDMAVVRASIERIPIALASATPSLETLMNVERGRYERLDLVDRHGGAEMPRIAAIDLRRAGPEPGQWIAPALAEAISQTLARGEQVLLFLNRRGYAPVTVCRACGARLECPHCSAWLVDHRYTGRVVCHHCGYTIPRPRTCPDCGGEDNLVPCGPGVERLAEEVAMRWPDARSAVMTSDTVTRAGTLRELVARIEAGAIDLVIGTQIVTKGYHFPRLTLVGVIDADLGLRGGDLRAGERTYQQIMQVAGRAGRAERAGRVFLQTYDPDHPVTAALIAGESDAFLAREADARRRAGMPPFARLAALLLSGKSEDAVRAAAHALARAAPRKEGIDIFGPAPAPLARLRGQFRYRLLVKARRDVALQAFLTAWVGTVRIPASVRLRIDIDPQSFQ